MNNLLHTPEGVRDVVGIECENKTDLVNRMWNMLSSYGYSLIDTPTYEYIECFSGDIGSTPTNELYKFTDRNGHTLALRPDFTPSIARVSAKYFQNTGGTIKLGYHGKVFKNQSSLSGRLHESTQLGAEYIGDSSVDTDAETIALAINCLLCSNIGRFKISIGHTDIINGLCEACGFDESDKDRLLIYINNKNFFGIDEFLEKNNVSPKLKDAFNACLNLIIGDKSIDSLIDKLSDIPTVLSAVKYLKELLSILEIYGVSEYVSLDLSLVNEYKYYTGIIFYGYTYGSGNAVLTGGRYDKLLSQFGKDAPAIGFAIYIDDLMQALKREGISGYTYEIKDVILYEKSHRVEAIKNANLMRSKGKKVLLVRYETSEELEKFKMVYSNDNLFLITDGR